MHVIKYLFLQRWLLIAILLAAVFGIGLGVRRIILLASYGGIPIEEIPYSLESALQYRRIKMICDRGSLPSVDESVSHPNGVRPAREYTVFVDYLQATLCGLSGDRTKVTTRLRWIEPAFFSLTIPMIALWGWSATRRLAAGIAGSLLYAVAISAVQRSTGAELSTENTALPFLAAHLLLRSQFLAADGPARRLLMWGSALALALALAAWDLMQFYAMMWAAIGLWKILRGAWTRTTMDARLWLAEFVGLIVLALVSPYHRSHGFIFSPVMVASSAGFAVLMTGAASAQLRWIWASVFCALLAGTAFMFGREFSTSYGHFGELLWAKLRFLNSKPDDPALLNFDQRLLWTPALHSPNLTLTLEILGLMSAASLPAALAVARGSPKNLDHLQVLLGFVSSSLAYVFFFRFHVYVAFFGALLVALAWGRAAAMPGFGSLALRVWLGLCIFGEFIHTLRGPWSVRFADQQKLAEVLDGRSPASLWGAREGIYYKEQEELTDWLAKNAAPDAVLAGFGLGGPIAAYGKCAVILHPKFETKEARDKVKAYAEELFKGSLESFRLWADAQGASWYVHGLGAFSSQEPTLQLRYMVDAMNPPPTSPARLFEAGRPTGPYFRQVFANRKYKVYKIMTKADEVAAATSLRRATTAIEQGDVKLAEREATQALRYNPSLRKAEEILKQVELLHGKGFPVRHE